MKIRSFFIATTITFGLASQALADPILPNATYSGEYRLIVSGYVCSGPSCTNDRTDINDLITVGTRSDNLSASMIALPGHPDLNDPSGVTASESLTVANTPAPSMYVQATTSVIPINGAVSGFQVIAHMSYSMEIVGPSGPVPVQVVASGAVSVDELGPGASSDNTARSFFYVRSGGGFATGGIVHHDLHLNLNSSSYTGPDSDGFNDSDIYNLQANTVYAIDVGVEISGGQSGNLGGGTTTVSAFVDPQFIISANGPSQYSLFFSSGIGNSAPNNIPEPPSLALFGLGVAGLGFMRRKPAATRRAR